MARITVKTHSVPTGGNDSFLVVCYDKAASEKFGYQALPALTTVKFLGQKTVAAIDHINGLMLIQATPEQERAVGDAAGVAWKVATIEV